MFVEPSRCKYHVGTRSFPAKMIFNAVVVYIDAVWEEPETAAFCVGHVSPAQRGEKALFSDAGLVPRAHDGAVVNFASVALIEGAVGVGEFTYGVLSVSTDVSAKTRISAATRRALRIQ